LVSKVHRTAVEIGENNPKVTRRLRGVKKSDAKLLFLLVVPAGGIEPTAHVEIM
jgi:hypothetical protein